jgi:hypothetical protein
VNIAVPPPRLARKFPVDRQPSFPVPVGDQPAFHHPATVPPPRWVRCPVDHQLHLLAPAGVIAAGIKGHGHALCGRLIPADGLTIDGPSGSLCISCLAAGTAS